MIGRVGGYLGAGGESYPASSFYAATANPTPDRPKLNGDRKADVCVIGAGYCGLSAALHLAERGYDVVVLEANRAGWGASGRNGGQIHSGQRRGVDVLEAQFGMERSQAFWQLGQEAKALVRSLIADHAIDCDLRDGLIAGSHKRSYVEDYRHEVEHLRSNYGYDKVHFLDRDAIREKVLTEDFHGGLLDEEAGHLHPLNFALGIAAAAEKAGAVVYENSRVTRLVQGDPARVETEHGSVTARFVIAAGNGYLEGLLPEIEARVLPINNFIAATEPLGNLADNVIPGREAVADSRFVINYFRIEPGGRMLFGGGENYSPRFPPDIAAFVRPYMIKLFPQLSNARIEYAWGGTLGVTMKRLPCLRRVGTNIYAACGFSGQGVTIAPLAGKLVADAIAGQAEKFDLYASLPAPEFPGGALLRHPILVLGMLWYALKDRL